MKTRFKFKDTLIIKTDFKVKVILAGSIMNII